MADIHSEVTGDVEDVEREDCQQNNLRTIAGNTGESDVEVHLKLLLATVVNLEPRLVPDTEIVRELRHSEHGNEERANKREDSTDVCADAHIIHSLSVPTHTSKRVKSAQRPQQTPSHGYGRDKINYT